MAAKKPFFDAVDPKVDFPSLEKETLKEWETTGMVKKYRERNKNSTKNFSFLDGPITANNPMGVHHAWGRTYKDLWQRYFNMKGYKQRFQNGFDCQGLWVEGEGIKESNEKSLIYKGRDSVPWCPRCGTAISQHERLTEDYKELTHETVFFKL